MKKYFIQKMLTLKCLFFLVKDFLTNLHENQLTKRFVEYVAENENQLRHSKASIEKVSGVLIVLCHNIFAHQLLTIFYR